ncbi:MAG: hypothetical protein HYW89_04680 [Candidatus Sungiibacteriota bacterium]|uniref:Uncharacterized protein n=1 Tax=Candidatus Sungiibacteriota bacterium TaxID=2750080 RepID=A0A7T5UR95_9BACT|nr:MAG: hypothetical protein HYW89_04680 [Candidatus Sungbacteria bacterium]
MVQQTFLPWGIDNPPPKEKIKPVEVDRKNNTVTFWIPSQQLTIKLKLMPDGSVMDVGRAIEKSRLYDPSALYVHDPVTFGQMTAMLHAILNPAQNRQKKQRQRRPL